MKLLKALFTFLFIGFICMFIDSILTGENTKFKIGTSTGSRSVSSSSNYYWNTTAVNQRSTATTTREPTTTNTRKPTATPTTRPVSTDIPVLQVKTRSTVSLRNSKGYALTQVTENTLLTLTSYDKSCDMFTASYNGKTYFVRGTGLSSIQNGSWKSISKDELITHFERNSSTLAAAPVPTSYTASGTYSSPYVVTVSSFVQEINSNKNKAAEKYNGKYIEITGKITYISDLNFMIGYYLYGKQLGNGLNITCWVDNPTRSSDRLKVGQTVTFRGLVREITTFNNTEIANCRIIATPSPVSNRSSIEVTVNVEDAFLRNSKGSAIKRMYKGATLSITGYDPFCEMFTAIYDNLEGYVKGTGLSISKSDLLEAFK